MSNRDPIIQLSRLTKRFEGDAVLRDVNLSIRNGEFLTFLGPSGCGKTTLLRIIAGFERPSEGEVWLDGKLVNDVPPNKREVNTVFQSYALFPHMSVFDNVAFGLKQKKLPKSEIVDRVHRALKLVKLEGLDKRKPTRLSGGQQQRVALARAVVNEPLVLLLDEPLSALDFKLRTRMQMELKHLQRQLGITFVFVTHDQSEAFTMSDRVAVMRRGGIVQIGKPVEIYEEPQSMFVARFVGEINTFDALIEREVSPGHYRALVEGMKCHLAEDRDFAPGDHVKVLLRPEDLRIIREDEENGHEASFPGTIVEWVYKGATVDIVIELAGGKKLQATEFFNEDSEEIDFQRGEKVRVSWVKGWEVVLPHEG